MSGMTALYITIAFLTLLFVYNFRTGITDYIYVAMKNWRYCVLVAACIAVGLGMGLYNSHLSKIIKGHFLLKAQPSTVVLKAQIKDCKEFIIAKRDNTPEYIEPEIPLRYVVKIKAKSLWDSCAHIFGTSYWNYDISIQGESGGKVLCETYYAQNEYRSGIVEGWCNTALKHGSAP